MHVGDVQSSARANGTATGFLRRARPVSTQSNYRRRTAAAVLGPQGLLVRIFGPAGPAPDISRAWRSATVHRRPSRASRRRWPFWAWCCPSVDFLLLFGAADTCAACSASVARSCRARWRTCAEGTTRPPAKPGLLLASVSTDASALFFFCVFLRFFFFFVGASESLPEPLALDWAAILPFCSGGLPSTRPRRGATQANRMPAPGPDAPFTFFGTAPG